MTNPTISVIMATYNESLDYLKQSIESILNQTYKDFEFIIVLDNPNNEKIENFIKNYAEKDSRIVFIKNEKNLGRGGARNKAIDVSKGKYIAILDADDIAMSDRLEKQLKFLEEENKDIIFSWADLIDENGKKIGEFKPSREVVENFGENILTKEVFLHPSMFLRGDILRNLKYDESLLNAQDLEFMFRAIKKGYKFSIVEDFLIKYRTPTGLSFDKRLKKLKGYSYFTFKALWKHKDYFWRRFDFWYKLIYSFLAWLSLTLMPAKFNIFLFKVLDRVRKK